MKITLKVQDIVLIGLFNLAKFDRHTFISKGIFKEDEISEKSVFSAEGINIETENFVVRLNTNQLVISSKFGNSNNIAVILSKMLEVMDILNLNASGFNFRYFIDPIYEDQKIADFIKNKFYNSDNAIQSKFFNSIDSTFGFYSSKDFKNLRLKLDVKPILLQGDGIIKKSVQFEFNFHKDFEMTDNSLTEIKALIHSYDIYQEEAEMIINSI